MELYYSHTEPKRLLYYRHHAFTGKFRRFENRWFLDITPTYHYTTDGRNESPYREDNLSGMKRQEGHQSVANNVRFLGYYLGYHDMFNKPYYYLHFGKLLEFDTEFGILDADWKNRADPGEEENPDDILHPNPQLLLHES